MKGGVVSVGDDRGDSVVVDREGAAIVGEQKERI